MCTHPRADYTNRKTKRQKSGVAKQGFISLGELRQDHRGLNHGQVQAAPSACSLAGAASSFPITAGQTMES